MTEGRAHLLANPLFRRLLQLGLPPADYAVFGSGPLLAHGLKRDVHDLDVIARGPAWDAARRAGTVTAAPSGNGEMVEIDGGRIQIFDAWMSPAWNVDALIDGADVIAGVRFVALADVLRSKQASRRAKDVADIELLRDALSRPGSDAASLS